jgi:NAD+ synthase (glutamine-hydrolysing)
MIIAVIQSNPVTGALAGNMDALLSAASEAAKQGAELCVAPELALCGHNSGDLLLRAGFVEECLKVLQQAAARAGRDSSLPPLLLGAPVANPVPQGKSLQSCAVLVHQGKVRVVGRKVLLPSNGNRNDSRYFEPGVACGAINRNGWRLAVTIGEDAWNDSTFRQGRRTFTLDPVADFIAAGGADGIINLTALPYAQGLPEMHRSMLGHLASRYRAPLVAANMVGGNDGLVYYGGSLAFDGGGALLARAPAFEEALLLVDLVGRQKSAVAPELEADEELWRAIVLGTRDFARKCGFSRAVLGLSGGVDSALVAAVAAEAFGPRNVTALLMPSPYSSRGSIDDSLQLARKLGITTHTLPVNAALDAFGTTFSAAFPGGLAGSADENTQARIRGTLLMAYANRFGALLLATGNKSEAAVGYCTLYGDLAGGIAPIGDLYKRQVYSLCRWYNAGRGGVIPGEILAKEPSAELRPGQKDSDSLPPYDVLDPLLEDIIENGLNLEGLVERGHDPATAKDVLRLVWRAEFKRHQAPPVLGLSRRSFADSWRMPVACTPVL